MNSRTARLAAGVALVLAGALALALDRRMSSRTQVGAGAADLPIAASFATAPVSNDADDPAIWVHPTDPSRSLLIGTDKADGRGGLYVFGLDGRLRQTIAPLDRPNNVDVEYGLALGGGAVDIVVTTERNRGRLQVFRVRTDASGLEDVSSRGGLPVLTGQSGAAGEPMGIALYRRPRDGAVFAIVSAKGSAVTDCLWQYRLADDGAGRVSGRLVRRFGKFSGRGEIEAVAVDDELGFVYYADELFGIHKWHADPDHPEASRELAVFGTDGYAGDREGLAVYARPGGRGYLLSVDQVPAASRLHLYPREGAPGNPHLHPLLAVVPTPGDDADGIEATSAALPGFPRGLVVMMNSGPRNFLVFPWESVESRLAGPR